MTFVELVEDRFALRLDIAAARVLAAVEVISIEELLELDMVGRIPELKGVTEDVVPLSVELTEGRTALELDIAVSADEVVSIKELLELKEVDGIELKGVLGDEAPLSVELIENKVDLGVDIAAMGLLAADEVVSVEVLLELLGFEEIVELEDMLGDEIPLSVEPIEDEITLVLEDVIEEAPLSVENVGEDDVLELDKLRLLVTKMVDDMAEVELELLISGVEVGDSKVELNGCDAYKLEAVLVGAVLLATTLSEVPLPVEIVGGCDGLELDWERSLVVKYVEDMIEAELELFLSRADVGENKIGLDIFDSCDACKLEVMDVGSVMFATTFEEVSEVVSMFVVDASLELGLAEFVLVRMVLEDFKELFV